MMERKEGKEEKRMGKHRVKWIAQTESAPREYAILGESETERKREIACEMEKDCNGLKTRAQKAMSIREGQKGNDRGE